MTSFVRAIFVVSGARALLAGLPGVTQVCVPLLVSRAVSGQEPTGTLLVPPGASWKHLDTGADLDTGWRAANFDDRAWPCGPAPLGFGEPDQATEPRYGPDPENKFVTYYFRSTFTVDDPGTCNRLYLQVRRDDGVVAYLNGAEVYRDNVPSGEAGGVPSASEHYCSFDHGNIHFISLDSITPELSASPDSPMLRWLRHDLAATPRLWKIAYWDGPPYTKVQDTVALAWTAVPGQCYRVYRRDTLDGPGRLIADQIQAPGDSASWSGRLDPPDTTGFFSVSTCSD